MYTDAAERATDKSVYKSRERPVYPNLLLCRNFPDFVLQDGSKVRFFTRPTISPVEQCKFTSFFETLCSLGYVFLYEC